MANDLVRRMRTLAGEAGVGGFPATEAMLHAGADRIEELEKALEPFASQVGIFGKDWMDNDELAVTPFFDEDERRGPYIENNMLLFTLKVDDLRRAARAYKVE